MQVREVDVAIIGAGTAGMTAYRIAREHTDNLLVSSRRTTVPPVRASAACRVNC